MGSILYMIGAFLVAMWLLGFVMHIGGGLIHSKRQFNHTFPCDSKRHWTPAGH